MARREGGRGMRTQPLLLKVRSLVCIHMTERHSSAASSKDLKRTIVAVLNASGSCYVRERD